MTEDGLSEGLAITRVFDAPRERVWQEWTEPERFADWFGGVDCDVPLSTVSLDVRPGGALQLTMYAGPERSEIRWRGEYHEVVAPERLVFSISARPEDEASYELVIVVLADLGDGRTEMLLRQRGRMTPEQYEGTRQGWSGFLERMAARLAEA